MEARPCQILEFFDGTKQLLVPLFQRPYEWGPKEWEVLWGDLLEQYEHGNEEALASHFTGAIVTAPARSVPVGVSKFLVIDGQQRLTTIAILVCALRSSFPTDSRHYRKLTRLLVNEDDEGLEYYKLLPTQPDRTPFMNVVSERSGEGNRFRDAFKFFRAKLASADSDGVQIDIERLVTTVQNRLTVVAIHLGDTDDPYLIFESLNAKGTPLTQADLIRNYLLLRLHSNEQQQAYETSWLPMQNRLPGEHLTEFMRQYLMQTGEEVAKSSIYTVLKKRLLSEKDTAIAEKLRGMEEASARYAEIIGLLDGNQPEIVGGLARLRRWDIATANPFILKLMSCHAESKVTTAEVAACLRVIESFAVRRTICGVPTNQLKRIFLAVAKDMPDSGICAWLSETLAGGTSGRRWPKNEEFREALYRYRAYAQPLERCKFILETLEESSSHKEPAIFDTSTIEHVMPQTLTDDWTTMLGNDAKETHERWLDLLGNLTLTGYNPELSNAPFSKKRQILADSHFEINKWISKKVKWTEDELKERTEILFAQASRIWERPPE